MRMKYTWVVLIASLIAARSTSAQTGSSEATKAPKNGIVSLHMKDLAREREILVYFTGPTIGQVSDIKPDQIGIRFLPSKKVIPAASITDPMAPNTPASPPP